MKKIIVSAKNEAQVNEEFINAWHRAERREIAVPEQRLYFSDSEMLLRTLSKRRLILL